MSPFERIFSTMTKPVIIFLYLSLIVVCWFYVDKPVAEFFANLDLQVRATPLNWLTNLGSTTLYLMIFSALILYFKYYRKDSYWEIRSWFLFLSVVIPSMCCLLLKVVLGRSRPELWIEGHYYGFYGIETDSLFWSFPSGHTSATMGVVFGLSIIFPRYAYNLIVLGVLIAVSRIFLVHHYVSDVLAAAYFALMEIGLLLYFFRREKLACI